MRPRIGLTVNYEEKAGGRFGVYVGQDYTDALYDAGAWPIVLAYTDDAPAIADIAEELDGLLLTGGDDIDPSLFGEEPHIGLGEVSPVRDRMEVALLRAVARQGKPVLGICRGIQVMNAVFGGTLYQDLPREWRGNLQHVQKAPRTHTAHTVTVTEGSRLHGIAQCARLPVNTFHHQAVKQIAPGFVATARSGDGLIEAIECPGSVFFMGVQWHPENLWRTLPEHRRLFAAFADACRGQKAEQQAAVFGGQQEQPSDRPAGMAVEIPDRGREAQQVAGV